MKNVAVTGSFCSGKSFVLQCIKSMGYKVFSSDDYVKKLYKDRNIQKAIENKIIKLRFFNKARLAKIVFSDDKERKKLENYIHPMVCSGIKNFEEENKSDKLLFTEVPLLFESNFHNYFSYNICVFCSERIRLERAKFRGTNDMEFLKKIRKTQFSQEEKIRRASFTINSEKKLKKIKMLLNDIINKLI